MKQISILFLPNFRSYKNVFIEISNTSISRERFIDFIKVFGLSLLILNSIFFIEFEKSGGEWLVSNLSNSSSSYLVLSWFTVGKTLFFFSMGFSNLLAWYSNVGREGSQWNYLADRINSLIGPVLVWLLISTVILNWVSTVPSLPNYLTTAEDGIVPTFEFVLWPLWLVTIYLVLVIFTPLTIYLHKKYPYIALFGLGFLTFLVDTISFPISLSYLELLNYLFFWLTVHQIGYFFADGKLQTIKKQVFLSISIGCFSYLFYKLEENTSYLSMTSYRLTSFNNEDPPTFLYLICSIGLLSLFLSIRNNIENFLNRKFSWNLFSTLHSNIYTVYLWHLILFYFLYLYDINLIYLPILLIFTSFMFGSYERNTFKLSSNFVKRVNPLQPWPTPIKARFSIINFSLAWVSAFLILLGVIHVTLGGIGQDGFNTIREFYFLSSSTFDGFSRILIGILLLNLTVRGKKYTKRLLTFGILLNLLSIFLKYTNYPELNLNNYYLQITTTLYFLIVLFAKSNFKIRKKVK